MVFGRGSGHDVSVRYLYYVVQWNPNEIRISQKSICFTLSPPLKCGHLCIAGHFSLVMHTFAHIGGGGGGGGSTVYSENLHYKGSPYKGSLYIKDSHTTTLVYCLTSLIRKPPY